MAVETRQQSELSRPLSLAALGEGEVIRRIEASEAEREAVAARLGLISIERLDATLRVRRLGERPLVQVSGRFEAEVTQACVVTLVPVRSHLADDIALSYGLDSRMTPMEDEEVGKEDPPEPHGPEGIDLGEAIVQYLAIALDPYPRAAEAGLERKDWGHDEDDAGQSSGPFAVLQALKSKT